MVRSASISIVPEVSELAANVAGAVVSAPRALGASNAPALLSAEERRQREDAVRFANASVGLEGFQVSPEDHARADRFIAGEIDLAEFLRQGQ